MSDTISLSSLSEIFKKDKLTIEVISKPSIEDLKQIDKIDVCTFKFNNKSKGTYFECHKDADYYIHFYKTFGKPKIYGLYEKNNETNIKTLIGTITLVYRYDNKVCQIMDLKIKKKHRGCGGVNKFIMHTLLTRLLKNYEYYSICMNTNTIVEKLINKISFPSLKNRGKMFIFLVSFDEINKILSTLSTFYCSEICFVDNNNWEPTD